MAVWTRPSDDDPLFHVQGRPIYVTELLLGGYLLFFILEAVLGGLSGGGGWIGNLALSTPAVLGRGWVWQLATYPLVNPVTLWFALEMLMLFWFGREVERAIGRRSFLFLYAALVVIPALVLVGVTLAGGVPIGYAGSGCANLGVFIAFALLFPEAELYFGGLLARWVAMALVAVQSLISLYHRDWVGLAVLWTSVGVAVLAIRSPLAHLGEWLEERRELRVTLRRQQQAMARRLTEEKRNLSIDPILEKISRQGLASLTREEKVRLEEARLDLLKRDDRKP